jgi:hypothetical protein
LFLIHPSSTILFVIDFHTIQMHVVMMEVIVVSQLVWERAVV